MTKFAEDDDFTAAGLEPHAVQRAEEELARDRRAERLLLWKGLLALLLALAVAYLRHRYFL